MKLREFKYQKPGEASSKRRVIVLSEDVDHVAGIDLDKLDKTEQDNILRLYNEFQDAASLVINKAFRNFKKSQILD
jgi:hypothetical protein